MKILPIYLVCYLIVTSIFSCGAVAGLSAEDQAQFSSAGFVLRPLTELTDTTPLTTSLT